MLKKTIIIADTHFISAPFVDYLVENGYKYCIAVSSSILQNIFKNALMKSVTDGRTHCADLKKYLCVTTESRKKVNLITNIFNVESCENLHKIDSRKVLKFYDDHKRKADQFNFLYSYYLPKHSHHDISGTRLTAYIFFIFTNAFLIYKDLVDKEISHKQFLLSVTKDLLNKYN